MPRLALSLIVLASTAIAALVFVLIGDGLGPTGLRPAAVAWPAALSGGMLGLGLMLLEPRQRAGQPLDAAG
ncbi:hypothetical protein M0638_02435 [Roseomonas sp. NAR14]|uniref:Uncharacterized protein n=1 Tax=Roseomonas acroporae TaxID=2937791 RepID=A0A9X2BSL1_9PROT|nr:hypothetical protein [Roseomonas acroporae]MCK8783237.1 hypothetical protein [Roseomonas acroporae]